MRLGAVLRFLACWISAPAGRSLERADPNPGFSGLLHLKAIENVSQQLDYSELVFSCKLSRRNFFRTEKHWGFRTDPLIFSPLDA